MAIVDASIRFPAEGAREVMVSSPSLQTAAHPQPAPVHAVSAAWEALCGKIVLMGGPAEAVFETHHPALGLFVTLAGGRRARIVILVQTSHSGPRAWESFAPVLRFLGAKRVDVVELPAREAGQLTLGSAVPKATGFLFIGDDPTAMLTSLSNSNLLDTVRSRHQQGAVIGGVGAGAAILGRDVIASASAPQTVETVSARTTSRKGIGTIFPGLSFLPGWVIDPTYGYSRNLDGLLLSLAANPALTGLGIEIGAGVVANIAGQVTSLGRGLAVVVDGRDAASDYAECREGEIVSISGPRLYFLGEGKRFDPRSHSIPALLDAD